MHPAQRVDVARMAGPLPPNFLSLEGKNSASVKLSERRRKGVGKKRKMFVGLVVWSILGSVPDSAGIVVWWVFHLHFHLLKTESLYQNRWGDRRLS